MKKILLTILAVAVVIGAVVVFSGEDTDSVQTANEATTTDELEETASSSADLEAIADVEQTFLVDTASTTVTWRTGRPLVNNYEDVGQIPVASSTLTVQSGDISGSVNLDVSGISVTEVGAGGGQSQLEEHLRSEDFLNVDEYPNAAITITDISETSGSNFDVTADLTLHGQTNEISFPATIGTDSGGNLRVLADIEIDRTRWGIRYRSGSFFEDLGDSVISDTVAISVDLIARPVQ